MDVLIPRTMKQTTQLFKPEKLPTNYMRGFDPLRWYFRESVRKAEAMVVDQVIGRICRGLTETSELEMYI